MDSDAPAGPVRHREGPAPGRRRPGRDAPANVVLKRGLVQRDSMLWDWWARTAVNDVSRRTVRVMLLDEHGSPVKTWRLTNAFPAKLTTVGMSSDEAEIAVEMLAIAFEGIEDETA